MSTAIVRATNIATPPKLGFFERVLLAVAPKFAMQRQRYRATYMRVRSYEAAGRGHRTDHWNRSAGDANAAAQTGIAVRYLGRDLLRNNGWARRGVQAIANHTVGKGIRPRVKGKRASALWESWAKSTSADYRGRLTFYAMQRLVIRTIVVSGEVLVVRHTKLGGAVPLALEILEPDHIDTEKGTSGIEYDSEGRRVAYWLFPNHPGNIDGKYRESVRVSADDVLHVFLIERPGQDRGISWLASTVLKLNDLDDYEDAALIRQRVAACFAAFVTDPDGTADGLGVEPGDDDIADRLRPGQINYLEPGQSVDFASPPDGGDMQLSTSTLRRIAASLGVSFEDLTADYSHVNFSSGRMGRIESWENVSEWQDDMLIPLLCVPVWKWFAEAARIMQGAEGLSAPTWVARPMPMIDPDKEGLAIKRLVRAGVMTPNQMIQERGRDPEEHWQEYAANMKTLDELEIVLDCDARKTSDAGLAQDHSPEGEGSPPPPGSAGS
jgi:lambda family phage portal protein